MVPLKVGKIKKIILDIRGNGGDMVLDARTFTDRFITKDAIFGYQRFKEDNNPFSYTPWTPWLFNIKVLISDILALLLSKRITIGISFFIPMPVVFVKQGVHGV